MMKFKRKQWVTYVSLILLEIICCGGISFYKSENDIDTFNSMGEIIPKRNMVNNSINIDGNAQLNETNGVTMGNGTAENPFIIENLTVNPKISSGISIKNTDAYLIIRNCTIMNSTIWSAGLNIRDAQNIKLINNSLVNNDIGIYLSNVNNLSILDNYCNNSNGDIYLVESKNTRLINNRMGNAGLSIYKSLNLSIDISNKVNEKSVIYHENEVGLIITGEDIGQVFLMNCNYSTIENTPYLNHAFEIQLYSSFSNRIQNNSAIKSIDIDHSDNNLIVKNNITEIRYSGIRIENSNNNTILFNILASSGISIENSYHNKIINNTIECNDDFVLWIENSNDMTIINNQFYSSQEISFLIYNSNNSFFHENRFQNTGLYLFESFNNSIDTTNKINGKSIRYFENQENILLSGNKDVGQVILINCNKSKIENLSISNSNFGIILTNAHNNEITNVIVENCLFGISLFYSDNNIIQNCNTANNKYVGIFIDYSHVNSVINNSINSNVQSGLLLSHSNNNTIYNNTCAYNGFSGLEIGSNCGQNLIWGNNFFENLYFNVILNYVESNNTWYYETTGNYYGDYQAKYPNATHDGRVWDTPYNLSYSILNRDPYPLVNLYVYIPPLLPPQAPTITYLKYSSATGFVMLVWSMVENANSYKIYRSTSPITDITNLNPIATTPVNNFYIDIGVPGVQYYYVVVASNAIGISNISNCMNIIIEDQANFSSSEELLDESPPENLNNSSTSQDKKDEESDSDSILFITSVVIGSFAVLGGLGIILGIKKKVV